jgi:cytochrome c oxidase subunit 3
MSETDARTDARTDDDRPGEPVRYGEGAEGFPHGSKYPLFVGAGMFFTALGLVWLPVLILGVPVLLYGIGGWTWEYTVLEYERGVVPEQKRQLLGIETGLLSAYVFVLGEILIFLAVFVSWFYLRAQRMGSFPGAADLPAPNLTLGAAMTGSMLVGSLAIYLGRRGIQRGDRGRFIVGYTVTTVAGLVFLLLLGVEYADMLAAGFDWTDGPYGSTYFTLTGLHALHLVGGLGMLAVVLGRAWLRGHFSTDRNLMPRTTEVYWHFLTLVSILVLAFVYLPTN